MGRRKVKIKQRWRDRRIIILRYRVVGREKGKSEGEM